MNQHFMEHYIVHVRTNFTVFCVILVVVSETSCGKVRG